MTEYPQNIAGPYQILSSRRPHHLACAYCVMTITFVITPINCITITFIIIPFNSVVSKQVLNVT